MKKLFVLILSAVMLLSLYACGSEAPAPEAREDAAPAPIVQETAAPTEAAPEAAPDTEPAMEAGYEITDTKVTTWTNSIGSTWVQTIVEITNTGSKNLYLSSGSYDLEDENGGLVASKTMVSEYPNVLAPGEKGYLYEETLLDQPAEGTLKVLPRVKVDEAKVDLIRYPVTDTQLSQNPYGGLKALGRVENTSSAPANMVYVVAFLYDADQKCIGQMFTILMNELAVGDKVGFEMSDMSLPDSITADSVANVVYYAYPMQLQF